MSKPDVANNNINKHNEQKHQDKRREEKKREEKKHEQKQSTDTNIQSEQPSTPIESTSKASEQEKSFLQA